MTEPLVSCLCITRNRRHWLPRAIRCFLEETYQNSELVIVSDGEKVGDLVPEDPRIRLITIEDGLSIGQKRNFAASQARGRALAHWDDDDYSAPGRIADQVRMLQESGKSVVGYSSMHFTDGLKWWLYSHVEHFAIGTSLCFRRDWWEAHPFEDVSKGEDGAFQFYADSRGRLVSCAADRMMVASIHPANTAPKHLDPAAYALVVRPAGIGSPFD